MREFKVRFRTSLDVQDFISWATVQPYTITVGNDSYQVNGSSFMGMFTLDYSRPLTVEVNCTEEALERLMQGAERFLAQ